MATNVEGQTVPSAGVRTVGRNMSVMQTVTTGNAIDGLQSTATPRESIHDRRLRLEIHTILGVMIVTVDGRVIRTTLILRVDGTVQDHSVVRS